MYLSYFGIRVRDLPRSVRFYTEVFGLKTVGSDDWKKVPATEPCVVLLKDPSSGQRLELNFYPDGHPYGVPYQAGEELDHVAFRVDDLSETLARLKGLGIRPEKMKHYEGPMMATPEYRVAYVRDPDGLQLELYDSNARAPVGFDPNKY